jgi:hypothetical protein
MDRASLIVALASLLPKSLAEDLVGSFIEIRQDVATCTLGRSAPGKFVETVVQALQHLEAGSYDQQPSVDTYLKGLESKATSLDDDLRLAAARVARSMYTLRNKRNIAHKGVVDPNVADLRFSLAGAQWLVAELLRRASGISMQDAGRLIDMVQAPIGAAVEDFGTHKLVLPDLSIKEELLLLLHASNPDRVTLVDLLASTKRRSADSVRRVVRQMWATKLVDGNTQVGYRLTLLGVDAALAVLRGAA